MQRRFRVFPGQPEIADFFTCQLVRAGWLNIRAAMRTQQSLAAMPAVDGSVLPRYKRAAEAADADIGGVMTGRGVPADGDGLADHFGR
jgi:hypothetical protein